MKKSWLLVPLVASVTSCNLFGCACGLPPGLNLNVLRQPGPADLQGVVQASGEVQFAWNTTAENVSLQGAREAKGAWIAPFFARKVSLQPDSSQQPQVWSDLRGRLQVQDSNPPALSVPLSSFSDWQLTQEAGQWTLSDPLALRATLDQEQARQLARILAEGPANQASLQFSFQTTLPAGTTVTLQLREVRLDFQE